MIKTFIYKIINLKNGKIYIGSTSNLKKRFHNHIWSLSNNKHVNTYLQHSWNKYGQENFEFEVIDYITGTRNDGYLLEQWYLDNIMENNYDMCYNFYKYARVPRRHTERLICVYDYRGELIDKDLTQNIADKYNINRRSLQEHCRNKKINHKNGFLFRYDKDTPEMEGRTDFKDREFVIHLDPLGGFINKFKTIREANKYNKYKAGSIRISLENKTRLFDNTYFVYGFDYTGDFKRTNLSTQELLKHLSKFKVDLTGYFFVIQVFDIEGNHIKDFKTAKELSSELKLNFRGVVTNIALQKKCKFEKPLLHVDKYILHVSGIYDKKQNYYDHNIEYFEIYDENGNRYLTSKYAKVCELLKITYDKFYKIKKNNLDFINNCRIIYHNLNK